MQPVSGENKTKAEKIKNKKHGGVYSKGRDVYLSRIQR